MKNLFKKIVAPIVTFFFASSVRKFVPTAAVHWLLVLTFSVFVLIAATSIAYTLAGGVDTYEVSDDAKKQNQVLNRQMLRDILESYSERETSTERLKLQQPTLLDPSM